MCQLKTRHNWVTINHENRTDLGVGAVMLTYAQEPGIPAIDALHRSTERLAQLVIRSFLKLTEKLVGVT